ncbi:MAG: exopolysaccharide Pel transporter PelG [Fervidobacterium sp.]
MAGIGFELNKLLKRNSFISDITALFYSANVSAGPWIISSTSVFLIQLFIPQNNIPFLISGIIYTFIFSTILFGSVSTSVTRYLSDLIYKEDYKNIYLLYRSSLSYAIISSCTFLLIFFSINGIREFQKIGLFSYSLTVLTIIWVQIVFISAIQKFLPVIISFSLGGITSFVLTIEFFRMRGEFLAYFGYNIGLMVIMILLQLFIKKYLYTEDHSASYIKDYGSLNFFNFFSKNKDVNNKSLFLEAIRTYKKQAMAGFLPT